MLSSAALRLLRRKLLMAAILGLLLPCLIAVSSTELTPNHEAESASIRSLNEDSSSELFQHYHMFGRRYHGRHDTQHSSNERTSSLFLQSKSYKSSKKSKEGKSNKVSQTDSRDDGQNEHVSKSSKPLFSKTTKTMKSERSITEGTVYLLQQEFETRIRTSIPPSITPQLNNNVRTSGSQFPTSLGESSSSLLTNKNPRKSCELVEIDLVFDSNPQDTSWFITLGDREILEEGDAIIVAESHLQYSFQDKELHSLCLPGQGQYTFTIFDWAGNGMGSGSYKLSSNGQTILEGGKFGWVQTHTFNLPLPELASESPSQSSQPTSSPAPTQDCTYIDISILFDSFPDETSWVMFEGDYTDLDNGSFVTIAASPNYERELAFTTQTYHVCIPGDGQYSFAIFDRWGNGLCCEFGSGGYSVTSPDWPEVIAQGSLFGTMDITTFNIPFAAAPSMSPSVSSRPTTSFAPTIDCVRIEIVILFDSFPSETKWMITESESSNTIIASDPYDDWDYGGVLLRNNVCLPGDGVYTFTISDSSADGICCDYGDGSYSVELAQGDADNVIASGGVFESSESTTFSIVGKQYVEMNPTQSLYPTTSPVPTVKCFEAEVSLEFGMFPYESMWVIVEGNADSINSDDWVPIIVAESPSYNFAPPYSSDTQTVCLEEGEFTFFMVDDGGDGIEDGNYTLTLLQDGSETVVAQGSSFETTESTTFTIPYVAPPKQSNRPTLPPGNIETSSPTTSPPVTAAPTISTPPTVDCIKMQISLYFDVFPYNIRWWLVRGDFNALESNQQTFIAESPSYYGVFYVTSEASH